jgi:hypothetical protein
VLSACKTATLDTDIVTKPPKEDKKQEKDFRTSHNLYEIYRWAAFAAR